LLAFAAFSLERAEGRLGRGGLAALGAGFLFGTAAALALDPPKPDAFEAQTDRLSVVFLSLSFLLACACAAADRFSSASERREAGSSSRWIRAAAVGLPLLAALAAWVLLFPKIAGGAEAVVGKFLAERWWSGILEIRPLSTATEYVVFVSLAFAALPAALERAARDTETDAEIGAGRRGRSLRWLLWGVACLGAIGLAVSHLRFTTHAEFIAALALFECVPRWAWAGRGEDLPGTGLRRPLLLAVFPCAAFLAVMAAGLFGASEPAGGSADASGAQAKEHAAEAAPKPKGPCDLRQTAPWLDKALPVPEVLMTTIMDAPTLQFLTRHSSVAGPYQRNRAGLEDLYAFYLSVGDDAKAKAMLAKRGIRHVLSCPGQYSNTLENLPGETGENLHSRLAGGGTPEWLEEEAWPEGTPATGYRLLRVSDRKH